MRQKGQAVITDFEWEIGENVDWKDTLASSEIWPFDDTALESHVALPTRRRPWRAVWIGLLLIASLVVIAIATLFQRAEDISSDIQQQVRSSYALLQQAIADSDRDLAVSLIAERDPRWVGQQSSLFAQRLLIDRSSLGLVLQSTQPEHIDVTLSDDLNTAQLSADYRYTLGEHSAESIVLRLSFPYRIYRGRWVFAPPRSDFREQPKIHLGQRINLTFFERDEAISLRLAADLNALIGRLCNAPNGITCPGNISVQLRLESDPLSLARAETQWFNPSDPFTADANGNSRRTVFVRLPSPALVGRPVDEAGYQALYRAYGTQVALVVIDQFMTTTRYAPDTYDALLRQIGFEPVYPARLSDRPVLLQQDVRLLCGSGVYRYSAVEGIWLKEDRATSFSQVLSLPNGDLMLIDEPILSGAQSTQVRLWSANQERIVLQKPIDEMRVVGFGAGDPTGRYQSLYTPPQMGSSSGINVIDLQDCSGAECSLLPAQGYPIWSPAGSHTLIIRLQGNEPHLLLGDASAQALTDLGVGSLPAWLDERSYAFARPTSDRASREIVIAHFHDEQPLTPHLQVLDTQALLETIDVPPDATLVDLSVSEVVASNSDLILVRLIVDLDGLASDLSAQVHLLLFNWRTNTVLDHLSLAADYPPLRLSPDGRWLVELDWAGIATRLRIHQLQSDRSLGYPLDSDTRFVWSRDGRWLLVWNSSEVSLFAPDADYKKLIASKTGGCSAATWVAAP